MANLFQLLHRYRTAIGVLILTACIQGGVLISQFLSAFFLTPNQVGVIRTVESILSIIVLGTSVGAPTLAIREIAALRDDAERAQLLKRLICMEIIVGSLVVVVLLLTRGLLSGAMVHYVALIAGVALLSNTVRVIAAFAQGTQTASEFSVRVVVLTCFAISVVCLLSWSFGVGGWVVGRYLGESAVLIGMLLGVRHYFRGTGGINRQVLPNWHVISLGITANLALFVRLLCDNLPILALAAAKVPTDKIGFFGLASLVLMVPNLLLAVTMQVELPRLVSQLHTPALIRERFNKLVRNMLGMAVLFFFLVLAAWIINREWLRLTYTPAINALFMMSFVLPLRAITLSIGTVITALGKYRVSVYVNIVEVIITGAFAYPLAKYFAVDGVVLLFVAGAVVSLLLHLGALKLSGLLVLLGYQRSSGRADASH